MSVHTSSAKIAILAAADRHTPTVPHTHFHPVGFCTLLKYLYIILSCSNSFASFRDWLITMAVSWGFTMLLIVTIVALITFSQPLFQLAIPGDCFSVCLSVCFLEWWNLLLLMALLLKLESLVSCRRNSFLATCSSFSGTHACMFVDFEHDIQ